MTEREKLDRQDFVDNEIHNLLNRLCPNIYGAWNQEYISVVRDAVQEVLVDRCSLTTEEEFYPYL